MRKYITIILLLFVFCNTTAQSLSDIGKITLSLVMPNNVDGLDAPQLSKLETKIIQIISATGLASCDYDSNFAIYPKFAIYETNEVEGGMQNLTVTTCELSLFIVQVNNNLIPLTTSIEIKGSGKNKHTSITNAISHIPIESEQFNSFIKKGKEKVIQYYESKYQDIITKSESLVQMQDYEQAIGLLMTVPEEVSFYNKILEKVVEVYKAYKNQNCTQQLQEAKIQLASRNFITALYILSQIDPSSICFNESQTLVINIEDKVGEEEKKQWDLKMKMYNNNVELERHRISAVKDIASAYYKSKPSTISYNYLVK